ncbi:tetratricopeptide repeat protein [Spirochaeta dissipatitropha]
MRRKAVFPIIITAALILSSCATQAELQRPGVNRRWDDSVAASFDDAHVLLQSSRDLNERSRYALHLSRSYEQLGAHSEALHYARIAERSLRQLDEPAYDVSIELIHILFDLEQISEAERELQLTLDSLTLSGDENLQGEYLSRIIQLIFSLDDITGDQFRRVTDRVLFIGDPRIRSSVLQETIFHMWQVSFSGDVTGIVQHAIAASSGVPDRLTQSAGLIYLSGLVGKLSQPVSGVDPVQLRNRGLRIWRESDLWTIDRNVALLAVRGSILSGHRVVLEELLSSVPGNSARAEILLQEAEWFLRYSDADSALFLLQEAQRYASSIDSDELKSIAYVRLALLNVEMGHEETAVDLIREARQLSPRYWLSNTDAAYAMAVLFARESDTAGIAEVISSLRDPVDQAQVYLELYSGLDDSLLDSVGAVILREVPFLLRRINWSRNSLLGAELSSAVIRAAGRGDTAFVAELRSIRPPQDLQVLIESRYAQALQIRAEQF